jgi:MATE family multidrug resistance protein
MLRGVRKNRRLPLAELRAELGPLARLAGPVVTAELGWMTMGLVDTMLVGRVSAEALGGVSVGSILFFAVAIFGVGTLLGLDYTVARAFGAGNLAETRRALLDGLVVALFLSVVLTGVLRAVIIPALGSLKIEPAVVEQARPFLAALSWSVLPLLLFTTLRRYLQAIGLARPVMVAVVTANLVNAFGAWALIFGRLGAPALGATGAGWATLTSRVYMFGFLLATFVWHVRRETGGELFPGLRLEARRLVALVKLGLPSALQLCLEVGVFAAATTLAGRLGATPLAAHQIALNVASLSFMVPLGVATAGAVRVGQAIGRGDPSGARRAGWTAVTLGTSFMMLTGAVFFAVPRSIVGVFTNDAAVIATGASLLMVAALFQLFDGLQVVTTGVLRGTGDTRTPMLANLLGHWLLGLPVGYFLCFSRGLGVVGLWLGLSLGLIVVAIGLVTVWSVRVRALGHDLPRVRRVA